MPITVEATYENGVLKPARPLPLKEREQVQITVHPRVSNLADLYGIMGFMGTVQEADYFAMDPELNFLHRRRTHDLCRPNDGRCRVHQ